MKGLLLTLLACIVLSENLREELLSAYERAAYPTVDDIAQRAKEAAQSGLAFLDFERPPVTWYAFRHEWQTRFRNVWMYEINDTHARVCWVDAVCPEGESLSEEV